MGFQQGLSGLNAAAKNLEVVGNNVSNANTYGFKQSRAEFGDVYAAAMNGAVSNTSGAGTALGAVAQQLTQGNITPTDNPLDLAINGAGFFQVADHTGQTLYTRNGQFKLDSSGYIVNNQSQKLMGYPATTSGAILAGTAQPLQLPTSGINPSATTAIKMEFNLDSRGAVTQPTTGATMDLAQPSTYNNATSLTVYDAKGQDVALTYYFQKAATDQWNVYVSANGTPLATNADGTPAPATTITFPANGGTPISPAAPVAIDIPAVTNASGAQSLAISGITVDVSGATEYGAKFGVTAQTQDGYAPGQLTGVNIETDGIITTRYSNGQTKSAGQLEIANFRNTQGLQPVGGNAWARTKSAGDPVVGVAGNGNLGVLQSGALEESNTDLTSELVNMITAQRFYQANAQTIKTEDQILQTLVNLR